MSVKSFKFVSPGVFINEIDNSFIPKSADAIGPVVIGRSRRGLAMTPVKVSSYSDFVTEFGDTVAGSGGGDVYRDGNYQSPMYGTYAAKAFLRSNVAPLTFIRLLGQQTSTGKSAGGDAAAGWTTSGKPVSGSGLDGSTTALTSNGGAYGLFLFRSGSSANIGEGTLAATFYLNKGKLFLSGNIVGPAGDLDRGTKGVGKVVESDSNGLFNLFVSGTQHAETITFGFDDTQETFLRKRFNTNPQVASNNTTTFYPASARKDYWLGESYEQALRRKGMHSLQNMFGVLLPIAYGGELDNDYNPANMKAQASREAVAGWFIAQDQGTAASYEPQNTQKLFRLVGRGHGEWLHKNAKVSIEKIRQSSTTSNPYGTFSVVVRDIRDTDNKISVLERFDNCSLDPKSPSYIGRKIGTQYVAWDSTTKMLKTYGDYPNKSKYFYVELDGDVEAGATDSTLLPFGYYGPPRPASVTGITGSEIGAISTSFVLDGRQFIGGDRNGSFDGNHTGFSPLLSGSLQDAGKGSDLTAYCLSGSLLFPSSSIRVSASDGGLRDPTNAYFGFSSTRSPASTRPDASCADFHRLPYANFPDDPTSGVYLTKGINAWSYIFSLDDIETSGSAYYYNSGSRKAEASVTSASYTDILDAGYNRFTVPFWGGADGWDITRPDPLYNAFMSSTSAEDNNYVFHTYRRAIDTVSDPEMTDMNLLTAPGLTQETLTERMIDICEERADALALIDLPNVYIPAHEQYYSDISSRIGTNPDQASLGLRDRRLDSSYGTTFYPWVQTRDEGTGQLVWVPPTVAILGVLGSSEAKTDVWFAPAGFNRGGLTDGAAGIPIVNVSERLTSKDRDTLYEYNINPIASFPSSGIVLFGQKTLQERQSALDRINVRRLVIYLKKQISILSTQILFEQNVQATWNRFKGLVEPFLANVKTRYGITDYRLILDESTTTPDLIDQNIMYAKIMIKPARAIEFIAIDFVILNTGASFDD